MSQSISDNYFPYTNVLLDPENFLLPRGKAFFYPENRQNILAFMNYKLTLIWSSQKRICALELHVAQMGEYSKFSEDEKEVYEAIQKEIEDFSILIKKLKKVVKSIKLKFYKA